MKKIVPMKLYLSGLNAYQFGFINLMVICSEVLSCDSIVLFPADIVNFCFFILMNETTSIDIHMGA